MGANRRHALVSAAALVVFAGCGSSGGESTRTLDRPDFQRRLEALARQSSSGAVALVQTEEGIWRGAAGKAEGTRRATPDDRFAIASTTKAFVATVTLQLVEEGRLSLDDPVERWLPGLLRAGGRITVRQLLNHTSGLPDSFSFGDETARARARDLNHFPLVSRPGMLHRYSNANYLVLGPVVEAITDQGLAEELRDRLIRPLGLDDTGYGPVAPKNASSPPAWLGTPLEDEGGPVSGDGGIVSTADDLAHFFQALFSGDVLGDDMLAEMTRAAQTDAPDLGAGLGVFRWDVSCGATWGHAGDQGSYSNTAVAAPDGSRVVVVAQNVGGWEATRALVNELFCS